MFVGGKLKIENEEEKKALSDLKNQLKAILQLDSQKEGKGQNYKIHGQQGDKLYGAEKSGFLLKRSEGVRKQWQKRYCVIKDGQFTLAHNQQSQPSAYLNLLTCQVKPSTEKEKKLAFALIAQNRSYLFQADDDYDYEAWISVLSNAREEALNKAFGEGEGALSQEPVTSISELTQGIIAEVKRLPGNNRCVDCNASEPTWLSTNLGILVCIECSGIHRDLGVHISRIRSLTLDRLGTAELLLARAVGNGGFNEIMEAELDPALKPNSTSPMDARKEFIQQKYIQKKFFHSSGQPNQVLQEEVIQAINSRDILAVLQLYADGVDFTAPIPDSRHKSSALHYSIEKEDLSSIHIVDFIIQNCKNVNCQDMQGNTALHLTALTNKTECLKLLVRGSIKLDTVNKDGKTAYILAQELGHKELAELLQDALDGKTGKFDQIKIDWGLQETEDIYATPADISDTMKMELREELEYALKTNLNLPLAPKPNILSRAVTPPANIAKTSGDPTPDVSSTTHATHVRHSVAFPASTSVHPPPLPERTHIPPPPVRKIVKPKAVPHPLLIQTGGSSASPLTTSPHFSSDQMTTSAPVLSTFNPKATGTLPSKTPVDSLGAPPTPPTRSTSFNPRFPDADPALPRPDRPPPPAPQRRGHQRNVSDGDILSIQGNLSRNSTDDDTSKDILNEGILLDPDAPPLPPPRPKQIQDMAPPSAVPSSILPSNSIASTQLQRTQSASAATGPLQRKPSAKRLEKAKYRRAKALYDCDADHEDELSFVEGEIIVMIREADPDWWFGEVEGQAERNGVFPISFVHVLAE